MLNCREFFAAYSTDADIPKLYATMRYIDSKAPTMATVKERNDVSHGMASVGTSS
jgi:hypothetical protein